MRRLTVALPGPLDLPASLAFLGRHGDDRIDRWDGDLWVRTLPVGGRPVGLAMRPVGSVREPRLRVAVEAAAAARLGEAEIAAAVRAQFVTAQTAIERLAARDPVVARLAARRPGLGIVIQPDVLHALIRSISAQQVNLAWAATTRARLVELAGVPYPVGRHTAYALDPGRLAAAPPAELRALQFSGRKAECIAGVAAAVAAGRLALADLAALDDEAVTARLTALKGLGTWTADWFLVRTLGRPRVTAGDLGVRKAVGAAYGLPAAPSEREVRDLTAHWGDAAAVAQQLALESLAEAGPGRGRPRDR